MGSDDRQAEGPHREGRGWRTLSRDPRTWLVVGAVVAGAVVAVRSRAPMVDDVGITARYAERIAEGKGWTYNDGDRTNGASAPLYTALLGLAHLVGIDVLVAARAIGVAAGAACAGLVAHVGARVGGLVAGATGAVLLLMWPFFQSQVTSGMESGFAVALGMGVIAALLHRRETLAGVLLGLALLNKLDAGMLAVAVAAAVLYVDRRPPWRIAAISAGPPLAWMVGSWAYFGSPLPNSLTQKASGAVANPASEVDPLWVLELLRGHGYILVLPVGVAALALVPGMRRARPGPATATAVTALWPLLHVLVFSFFDLGDTYPWYVVATCPPLALGAGITIGAVVERLPSRARPLVGLVAAGLLLLTVVAVPSRSALRVTARTLVGGHVMTGYDGLEQARQEAGQRLGRLAEPGDVVATCFGWIAYHVPQATIDETCPLNTRDPVGLPTWYVDVTVVGHDPAPGPAGWTLVDSVLSDVGDGARVDIYRDGPP